MQCKELLGHLISVDLIERPGTQRGVGRLVKSREIAVNSGGEMLRNPTPIPSPPSVVLLRCHRKPCLTALLLVHNLPFLTYKNVSRGRFLNLLEMNSKNKQPGLVSFPAGCLASGESQICISILK